MSSKGDEQFDELAAALSGSVEEPRVRREPTLHGAYFARRGRNHREGNTLVDPAGVASCRAVRVWLSGEAPACKAVYTGSNPVIRSS